MSELQLALIGFGALLVVAVWGYNLWQARQHRRRAAAMLPPSAPDVLMAGRAPDATPQEPTLGDPDSDYEIGVAPPLPQEWADGRVDCLLRVEFQTAVPVADVWREQSGWAAQIGKPLQWLGLDVQDSRWRALLSEDAGSVMQIAVALQLADRRGATDEAELAAFLDGVRQIAHHHAGSVDLPAPAPLLAQAHDLDAFCATVDLQLDLLVIPRNVAFTWQPGANFGALLVASGLQLEGERFVVVDADGAVLFALACQTATGSLVTAPDVALPARLVFSLDVPRVANGAAAFDRMLDCARGCAAVFGGQLADAHSKPLADATIDAIRCRIDELQGRMAQHGIVAGSVRALRLFS